MDGFEGYQLGRQGKPCGNQGTQGYYLLPVLSKWQKVKKWWDNYFSVIIMAAIVITSISILVGTVFASLELSIKNQKWYESKCYQAKNEILKCPKNEGFLACQESAKLNYNCMVWPDSWRGK
jgi:hypothetical protein